MTFQFTQEMRDHLTVLMSAAEDAGNYSDVYQYIYDQITVVDYIDPITGTHYADGPAEGVDKSVWLWVRGAKGVNEGDNGFFSNYIRDWTSVEYDLRNGEGIPDSGEKSIQDASNRIAQAFVNDILNIGTNNTNPNHELPSLERTRTYDAGAIASGVFDNNYSPWAGTILFAFLGDGSYLQKGLLSVGTTTTETGEPLKALNGTYDLIAAAQTSHEITSIAGVLYGSVENWFSSAGGLGETIERNSIGKEATLQLLADLRLESNQFFQSAYGVENIARFQIGGDLPLYGEVTDWSGGTDYFFHPNYIVGTLNNDYILDTFDEVFGFPSSGHDIVNAGLGDDTIFASTGDDLIDGAEGNDTLDFLDIDQSVSVVLVSVNGDLYQQRLTITSENGSVNTYAYGIENLALTAQDDTVDFSVGLFPVSYFVDGRGGENSFKGSGVGFYDEIAQTYYQNGGAVKLDNFQTITDTVIVADVHNARVLEGLTIESLYGVGSSTQGQEYSFKASDVGANIDVTISSSFTSFFESSDSQWNIHATREISADYDFEGAIWSGNIVTSDLQYRTPSFLGYFEIIWQTISGTDQGDTYNIHGLNGIDDISPATRLAIGTGAGNDVINLPDMGINADATFAVTYNGGDDVVNHASSMVNVDLWSDIVLEEISVSNIQISDDMVTSLTLNFARHGSLTLNDLSASISSADGQINDLSIYLGNESGYLKIYTSGAVSLGGQSVTGGYHVDSSGFYGNDDWTGTYRDETYHGQTGDDTLFGMGGNDTIYGDQGDDLLDGGDGENFLFGGIGNDDLYSSLGMNYISGGDGSDVYYISTLATAYIDDFDGAAFDDNAANRLLLNGTNTLVLSDELIGEVEFVRHDDHTMEIVDQAGWTFAYLADYTQFSYVGSTVDNSLLTWDQIFSGNGGETYEIVGYSDADDIVLGNQISNGFVYKYDLAGGNDSFFGTELREVIDGGTGDDRIYAFQGDDDLYGGDGNDILNGGQGNDLLDGGEGLFDRADYSGAEEGVIVNLLEGTAQDGFGTVDTLVNIEQVAGSAFDDIITGDDGSFSYFYGGDGNDQIFGLGGIDNIFAGNGDDLIVGGAGDDYLDGGLGNDVYLFNPGDGEDIITDSGGEDVLHVGSGLTYTDMTFTQIGNDLNIHIASGVTIKDQFGADQDKVFEWIEFDDGSRIQLPNGLSVTENVAPVLQDDVFALDEDTVLSGNVLVNDTDADGDTLLVQAATITTALGATVNLLENGDFTYTPLENFNGADSFTYTARDGHDHEETATVSLTILAVNDGPVAMDDQFAIYSPNSLTGNLLLNDTDVDGDILNVVAQDHVTTASGALLTVSENGDFTYSAIAGFMGHDSFSYEVSDGQGGTATAQVDIAVTASEGSIIDSGSNLLVSGRGDSTMYGLGGNDLMFGRDGNDQMFGGIGHDVLYGGNGNDLLVGSSGKDTLFGGNGNDILVGGDVVIITHEDGSREFRSAGTDTNNDILMGGNGNDLLIGGGGRDLLYGDGGADTFMFLEADGQADQIFGFNTRQGDKIDLSNLLEGYDPLSDAIADFVQVTTFRGQTTISVDVDGGADNFVNVVTVSGNIQGDLDNLISKGTLVV